MFGIPLLIRRHFINYYHYRRHHHVIGWGKLFDNHLKYSRNTNFNQSHCLFKSTSNILNNCKLSRKMTTKTDITFKFINYDCIGFDLDNTIARYKVGAMIEMEYDIIANFLITKKGYSTEHLLKPFDHNFIIKGLIVDDENGNLLRIGADGLILQAAHGTKMLNNAEIESYYKNRRWDAADLFAKDPLATWNGPYSEKMRTLLDYFDIAASLIFARAVDSVDQKKGGVQKKYDIWPDILDALQDMFQRDHFQTNEGVYFEKIKNNPEKYYYRCSDKLLNWLKSLKELNKILFLLTGSHVDFVSHTASNTIGPNWRNYFDIVVCFAKKPGFFTENRYFRGLDGIREIGPINFDDLKLGGIYTYGNFNDLQEFLKRHINKKVPKFLYIGDNLVQDIYAPNKFCHCDTVTVCEELEAEGMDGHQAWHPDQQFLTSTIWGSYFHCNKSPTNWYDIMIKHSKLCVPNLEYVASLPVDHEYRCNKQ